MINLDLTDRVAVVTGGSKGIGRAICRLLAKAGAKVVINFNRSEDKAGEVQKEINEDGGRTEIFKADISNPDEVKALFDFVRDKFGHLDILVNNAGVIKDNLLLAMDLSEWDKVLDTNLRGAFMCTKEAAEMMMSRHKGKILNISSIGAIQGGRGQSNYASAKGGLISFTRSCAVELAPKGIQVNAVLPGMIVTDMSKRVRKRAGDMILQRIPAGRFGEPVDIAGLVAFLVSDMAGYITGQSISVDGGMSIS